MQGGQARMRGANLARFLIIGAGSLLLANCASHHADSRWGVSASPRVVEPGQPVPKGGGTYRVGKPYMVAGQLYVPEENRHYRAEGMASWYGEDFHGRLTANGEVFDMEGISAAHPTLPMPSYARVTNLRNGRSLIVRINDRGPYVGNRLIDVSTKAAHLLGFRQHGTTQVQVEYVGPAPLEGSDDRVLAATLREGGPAPAPSAVRLAAAPPFVPEFDGRRTADVAAEGGERGEGGARPDRSAIESQPLTPPPAPRRYGVLANPAPAAGEPAGEPGAGSAAAAAPRAEDPIASYISGRGIY